MKFCMVLHHCADYMFVCFGIIEPQNTDPTLVTLKIEYPLNPLLLNTTCPVLANSVDPDGLASEEAN